MSLSILDYTSLTNSTFSFIAGLTQH